MAAITVVDHPQESRFEARTTDGVVVGFIEYEADVGSGAAGENVVVTHTVVDPASEGQGIGSQLTGGALDLIRASGRGVVPLCPFVSVFIRRHPEYQDLVVVERDTGQGG
ncbi:MAG TPA: GNAT family N-acetyltransferase [Cellulomonas sp.]